MPAESKPSALVLRCTALAELLVGAVPHGLPNKAIAEALRIRPGDVTRAAQILIAAGWLEKLPDGNFAVTSRFSRLTFKVNAAFDREQQRFAAMQRNYTLSN